MIYCDDQNNQCNSKNIIWYRCNERGHYASQCSIPQNNYRISYIDDIENHENDGPDWSSSSSGHNEYWDNSHNDVLTDEEFSENYQG